MRPRVGHHTGSCEIDVDRLSVGCNGAWQGSRFLAEHGIRPFMSTMPQRVVVLLIHVHGPIPALSFDRRNVLAALGERALGWQWCEESQAVEIGHRHAALVPNSRLACRPHLCLLHSTSTSSSV